MEFFASWAVILGLIVVPALLNYYVNRYYTPPGEALAPRLELITASLAVTFSLVVLGLLVVLLIAQGSDDLKEQIADFIQLGLIDYAGERPIALTGVMTAASVADMAVMALLGAFRIPSRYVK